MPPRSGFLDLPRELRDTIYYHYVFEIDGYHFDYTLGKLRRSDNRKVDMNLMYTCSLVATEMHNVALRSNVINFFTLETERKQAALFNLFLERLQGWHETALWALRVPEFQGYKTPEVDAEAALRYPQFKSLLSEMDHEYEYWEYPPWAKRGEYMRGSSWGEADSVFRAFQEYMIKLVSKDTDFPEALAKYFDKPQQYPAPAQHGLGYDLWVMGHCFGPVANPPYVLRHPSPELWSIPSKEELVYMKTCLGSVTYRGSFWKRIKWRL